MVVSSFFLVEGDTAISQLYENLGNTQYICFRKTLLLLIRHLIFYSKMCLLIIFIICCMYIYFASNPLFLYTQIENTIAVLN